MRVILTQARATGKYDPLYAIVMRDTAEKMVGGEGMLKTQADAYSDVVVLRLDDQLKLKDKMEEYSANGARLGWLIDPSTRRVYVYRPGADVEELERPTQVSGDPELRGLTLTLQPIWEPGF
jgi:hypothetical protein